MIGGAVITGQRFAANPSPKGRTIAPTGSFPSNYAPLLSDLRYYFNVPPNARITADTYPLANTAISSLYRLYTQIVSGTPDSKILARRAFVQQILALRNSFQEFNLNQNRLNIQQPSYTLLENMINENIRANDTSANIVSDISLLVQLQELNPKYALQSVRSPTQSLLAALIQYQLDPSKSKASQDSLRNLWMYYMPDNLKNDTQFLSYLSELNKTDNNGASNNMSLLSLNKDIESLSNQVALIPSALPFYLKIARAQSLRGHFNQKPQAARLYEELLETIRKEVLNPLTHRTLKELYQKNKFFLQCQLMSVYLVSDNVQFEKARVIANNLISNASPEADKAYAQFVLSTIAIEQQSQHPTPPLEFSRLLNDPSTPDKDAIYAVTLENGFSLQIPGRILILIRKQATPSERKSTYIGAATSLQQNSTDQTHRDLIAFNFYDGNTTNSSLAQMEARLALPHYLQAINTFEARFRGFIASNTTPISQLKGLAPTSYTALNDYIGAKLKTYTIPAFNFMNKEEVASMSQLFGTKSTDVDWHTLQFKNIDNLLLALHGTYKGGDPFLIFAQNNPAVIKNALGLETTSAQDLAYFELQVKSQHLSSKDYYISQNLIKTQVSLDPTDNELKALQAYCLKSKGKYEIILTPQTAQTQLKSLVGSASKFANQYLGTTLPPLAAPYKLVVKGKVTDLELSDLQTILPSHAESMMNLSITSSGTTERNYQAYYTDLKNLRSEYVAFLNKYGNVKQYRRDNDELQILTVNTRLLQMEKQLDVYTIKPNATIDPVEIGSLGGIGRQKWASELALFERYLPKKKPLFERLLTLQGMARQVVTKSTPAGEDFLWRFGEGKELLLSLTLDIGYEYMALMAEIKRTDKNPHDKYLTCLNNAIAAFKEAIEVYNKLPVDKNKPQVAIYGANAYKSLALLQKALGTVPLKDIEQNAKAALNLYQGVLADIGTKSPSEITRLYRAHFEPPYQSAAYDAEISKLSVDNLLIGIQGQKKQPLAVGRSLIAKLKEALKQYNDLITRIERNPMVNIESELLIVNNYLLSMGNLLRSTATLREQMTESEREELLILARSMAAAAKSKTALSGTLVPAKPQRSLNQLHRQAMFLAASIQRSLGDHHFEKLNEPEAIKLWKGAPEHILALMGTDGYYVDYIQGLKSRGAAAFNLEDYKNSKKFVEELCKLDLATVEDKAEAKLMLGYITLAEDFPRKNKDHYLESLKLFDEVLTMKPSPQSPDILINAKLGKSSALMELLAFDWSAGRYPHSQTRFTEIERALTPITTNKEAFNTQRAQAYFMLASINAYRLSSSRLSQAIDYAKKGIALLGDLEKNELAYDKHLGYQAMMQMVQSLSRTDTGLQAAMEIVTAVSNNTELKGNDELIKNLKLIIASAKPTQLTRDEGQLNISQAGINRQLLYFQSSLDNIEKANAYVGVQVNQNGKLYRQYKLKDIVNIELQSAATYNDIDALSIDAHQQLTDAQANKELVETIQRLNNLSAGNSLAPLSMPGVKEQRTLLLSRALMLLWSSSDMTLDAPLTVDGVNFPPGKIDREKLKNKAISILTDALNDKSVPIITRCKYKLALTAIYNRIDEYDLAYKGFKNIEADIAGVPATDKAVMDVNLHLRLAQNWSKLGKGYLYAYSQDVDLRFDQAAREFNDIIKNNADMLAQVSAHNPISIEFQKQLILAYTGLGEIYGARKNNNDSVQAERYFIQALAIFGNNYPDFQVLKSVVTKAINMVRELKDPRFETGLVAAEAAAAGSPVDFPRENFNAALNLANDLMILGKLSEAEQALNKASGYLKFELDKAGGNIISADDYSRYFDIFKALVNMLIQRGFLTLKQGEITPAIALLDTLQRPKDKTKFPPVWIDLLARIDLWLTTTKSQIYEASGDLKAALPTKPVTPKVIFSQANVVANNLGKDKIDTGIGEFSEQVNQFEGNVTVQRNIGNFGTVRKNLKEVAPLLDPQIRSKVATTIGGNALALAQMQVLRLRAIQEHNDRDYPAASKTMDELFKIFENQGGGNWNFELSSYLLQIGFLIDAQSPERIEKIFKDKLHVNLTTGKVELPKTYDEKDPDTYRKKQLAFETTFSQLIPLSYADYLMSQRKYKEALSVYSQVIKDFPSNPEFRNINNSPAYFNALNGQLKCLIKDMSQLTPERQSLIEQNIATIISMTPKDNELHNLALAATKAQVTNLRGDTFMQQGRYRDAVNAYETAFALETSRRNIGYVSMLSQLGIKTGSEAAAKKHIQK